MKAFVGLVALVVLSGLILVAAAGAFVFGFREAVEVTESIEEIGVSAINVSPRPDEAAIEVQWVVIDPEATYMLERATDPEATIWEVVFTLEPGSDAYVDEDTAVYLDEAVTSDRLYYYRFHFTTPEGGEGYTTPVAVTAP